MAEAIEQSEPAAAPAEEYTPKPLTLKRRLVRYLAFAIPRLIVRSLRMRTEGVERIYTARDSGGGAVCVAWHGRSVIGIHYFRGAQFMAMVSHSRDGDLQSYIIGRSRWEIVRGSTGRGAVRATIQVCRKIQAGKLLMFTPDGPRGPTHKVQPGTIFIAQRAGCPIIPMGYSARPRKLLDNWDHHMIPAPFGRGAIVIGEPIEVPSNMDGGERAALAERLERAMNACEKRAEEMLGFDYPAEYATT